MHHRMNLATAAYCLNAVLNVSWSLLKTFEIKSQAIRQWIKQAMRKNKNLMIRFSQ